MVSEIVRLKIYGPEKFDYYRNRFDDVFFLPSSGQQVIPSCDEFSAIINN